MRLPWQRRVAGRVEVERAGAPEPAQHAWRALPALSAGIDTKPPLTARSVELADSLSRRLASTGERPRLIHRAGLPEAASAGTVRGLAIASAQSQRRGVPRRAPGDLSEEGPGFEPEANDRGDGASALAPSVIARQRPTGRMTSVDAALAALVARRSESRAEPPVEETDPGADLTGMVETAPATPQPELHRTVIRRRPGSVTPRPLGLQAPLAAEHTRHKTADVEGLGEQETALGETAPRAVAATVGRLHRSDVTDVRVRRDREADVLAASENARAVTRDGEVFIPASVGPLDSGSGRGLLAHELTHVIQQRRLGRSVPLEHSPAGRRLEADAAMTERHVRGDLGVPAPQPTVVEAPAQTAAAPQPAAGDDRDEAASARDIQDDLVASGRAFRMPDGSLVFPGAGGHLPEQRFTRVQTGVALQGAPDDPAPAESPATGSAEAPSFAPGPGPMFVPPPGVRLAPAPSSSVTEAPPAPAPFPREPATSSWAPAPSSGAPAAGATAAPAAEEAAPIDLDDLARRVYGQVRTQLRSELLIDRERAGLLTDFR